MVALSQRSRANAFCINDILIRMFALCLSELHDTGAQTRVLASVQELRLELLVTFSSSIPF